MRWRQQKKMEGVIAHNAIAPPLSAFAALPASSAAPGELSGCREKEAEYAEMLMRKLRESANMKAPSRSRYMREMERTISVVAAMSRKKRLICHERPQLRASNSR